MSNYRWQQEHQEQQEYFLLQEQNPAERRVSDATDCATDLALDKEKDHGIYSN